MRAGLARWVAEYGGAEKLGEEGVKAQLVVVEGLLEMTVLKTVQVRRGRLRPHFDDPVLTLTTYSFPSGHTAGATVFYGFLAAFLLSHPRAQPWRGWIVAVAVAMIVLVGVSRIYLGVHYLTDVVAALVEGVLWLAICLAGVRALWRRRCGTAG